MLSWKSDLLLVDEKRQSVTELPSKVGRGNHGIDHQIIGQFIKIDVFFVLLPFLFDEALSFLAFRESLDFVVIHGVDGGGGPHDADGCRG